MSAKRRHPYQFRRIKLSLIEFIGLDRTRNQFTIVMHSSICSLETGMGLQEEVYHDEPCTGIGCRLDYHKGMVM